MDLGITTLIITAAIVFMAYRLKVVAFTQATMEGVMTVTSNGIQDLVVEQEANRTRKMGKIADKLEDGKRRETVAHVKDLIKNISKTTETE